MDDIDKRYSFLSKHDKDIIRVVFDLLDKSEPKTIEFWIDDVKIKVGK